jgi:hypothetical protein
MELAAVADRSGFSGTGRAVESMGNMKTGPVDMSRQTPCRNQKANGQRWIRAGHDFSFELPRRQALRLQDWPGDWLQELQDWIQD